MSKAPPYYPALTGFRAVAALLVFAYHFNPFQVQRHPMLHAVVNEGHIGVSLFFVLSGFLITMRYADSDFRWRPYLINRVFRIYPLYFLLTFATFVLGYWLLREPFELIPFLANISLMKGFSPSLKFTGIPQAWSLTVEETFYILAPFLLMVRRPHLLLLMALSMFGLCLIAGKFSDPASFFHGDFWLIYTFAGRSFEFACGVWLAKMLRAGALPVSRRSPYATILGFGGVLTCLLTMAWFAPPDGDSLQCTEGILVNHLALPACSGMLLYGLTTEASWLNSLLSNRVMEKLGKASYALYLIHVGVFYQLFAQLNTDAHWLWLPIAIAASVILYEWVEKPLFRLGRLAAQH